MEEDFQEGPFTMWQMFNNLTTVLFNNLDSAADGLDKLLISVHKLSGDYSEILVPRSHSPKCPDSYYSAFNSWLLGRLFYVCSVKELSSIHLASKDAQSKILNILCTNRAPFHIKLQNEYHDILVKLVQYYKEQHNNDRSTNVTLNYFTPEEINLPYCINLDPIYVNVTNIDTCKTLLNITLDIISESLSPSLLYVENYDDVENKLLCVVLEILKEFDMSLKYEALKFFTVLTYNMNEEFVFSFFKCFPNTNKNVLICIEEMLECLSVLYEKNEINDHYLQNFNTILLKFIKLTNNETLEKHKNVFKTICTLILSKQNKIFNKQIKLYCYSLSCKLDLPREILSLQGLNADEIEILCPYFCENMIENIKSRTDVDFMFKSWYYTEVVSAIMCIKACEDGGLDIFVASDHLQRCFSALNILLSALLEIGRRGISIEQMIHDSNILIIYSSLSKFMNSCRNQIVRDVNIYKCISNIILSIICLTESVSADDSKRIYDMILLKTSLDFFVDIDKHVKLKLLENILVINAILKSHKHNWGSVIEKLLKSLQNERDVSKEIVSLGPLLLLNNHLSPSKLMGDILMPLFMTKEQGVQEEITKILPAITCLSLDATAVVLNNNIIDGGHVIFTNKTITIAIVCPTCNNFNNITKVVDTYGKKYKVLWSNNNTLSASQNSVANGIKNLIGKFLNYKYYGHLNNCYWDMVSKICNHFYIFDFGVSTDVICDKFLQNVLRTFKPFLGGIDIPTDPDWMNKRDSLCNMCINLLVKSTQTSLEANDFSQQTFTLDCVKDLGLNHNDKLIVPVTKLLIYFIMHPQSALAAKAIVYLRDICDFHGSTPNQIYHRYKKDYCKLFVECSLYNGKDFAIYLLKVVRAFGFVGYRDFISKDVHHFLPFLIPYAVTVKEVTSMIEEIASLVQCSVSDFLIERFPHIYVHVHLTESSDMAKKCNDLMERLTKLSILNLIKRHFRIILTEFLLQYCTNPEKVLNACRYLACHDPDVSTPTGSMSMNTAQIADFLNPKFLGVLAYFDHKLVNSKVALSVKRKALKSFPDILQLMGVNYLSPLRYKVLATLRSAMPLAREFPKILAAAWAAFIQNIDTFSLGPLMSTLSVSLLQQLKYARPEINKIFHTLVLNNENILCSYIPDLFFLEDSNISERVKVVIKKHVKRTLPDNFLDRVKWYLKHLNQDISHIKAVAYTHLDKLLKNNRTEIHKAIFGGKCIDPVIVELIDYLLTGCKDSDVEVSTASGFCLGQLGAIEAGHLPRQYVQSDSTVFAFTINDNCFAATALLELARAFQYEKDTTNMDCYALTIQEILKIYEISPTGSKKDIWFTFSENLIQIMTPLLSSRYTLAYPSQPKKAHPLFGSVYAATFLEWAHNWAGQLIPLIESESIRELLRTVHPSMRRDVRTLFLFLPYVLLHAIMSKTNIQYIQEEMLAVIASSSSENFETTNMATSEKSKYKILRHIRMTPNINTVQSEEGTQSKCSKTIYTLLDFLNRWLLEWTHVKQRPLENENYKTIKMFEEKFDKLLIARGNFACGELERALQYLELYMDENKAAVQEQLPFLAEIYALLDEPDSVAGIMSIKQSEPSIRELILAQVVTGRMQDAALCYERLAREGQLDKHSLRGMIDCYLGLDQPFTALQLLNDQNTEEHDMYEMTAEPLWRLGRFEQLEDIVNNKKPVPPSRENWGLLMGRILLSFRKQDNNIFKMSCGEAARRLMIQMQTDTRGESALRTTYQSVLGLHIITEAGHAEELVQSLKDLGDGDERSVDLVNQMLNEWRQRLSIVQSDVRTIEPLLRIRRILLQQTQELLVSSHPLTASKLRKCIGDLWIKSAKFARQAGNFQQAYMYVLNAEEYNSEQLFIEKSKMYWARGQKEHAFTTLRRGLKDAFPSQERLTDDQKKICAKAKLLIAKYNDETTNVDVDVNIGYYKEAVDIFKQWEKSLVCLGSYYEKVSTDGNDSKILWPRRLNALNSYGKALQYGHKYLYQSMPRMLSIWLDVEVKSTDTSVHSVLAHMTDIIKTYSERLPIYLYLTAFSQIVSRICHPVKEVYLQLKAIIVKLIVAYPQHTLWMMLCVLKSSYEGRVRRCNDVLMDPRLREPRVLRLLNDFTKLAESLIELCNKPITEPGTTTTVSALVRTLPRLLAGENFSHIMMPFEEFCKIVLPSKAARQERLDISIPAEPQVYIAGIQEKITIIPSLQKPRKVTLTGSDGKAYIIMLKPRDDLRKDFRLMEFNCVVNRFLQDDPETRRRRLYIRTYSVLPLNEECGLIEWVPNLVGLRPILMHIYKQKGLHTSNRELKEMMCANKDPVEKKRRIFEEQLVPRHPAVFQEWFRRVFSDPCAWYQARSAYIRTTAVMSMVGYILGLGDRHGENISFDSTNGDTVHVDFNCLFNKGEAFEWPERVPFRLTHNMQAAMGPLKHEGMFRKSCEAVMCGLRAQTAALMSVVEPFVYDPLVAWARARLAPPRPERTNDQAVHHLAHIRQRLNGMVKTKNKQLSLSLSPEGQVEHLIVEATSIDNLCQMYIGWGPFL